ncbi:hypothetical protein H0H92_008904 [Tricholoma furcatifolium]|nr:hypothetical protein H0H92_008904 [Tricholoma furcatifolium]
MPVFAGELSSKVLGIKVEVYDLSGVNIENTSEAGELVVTRPHPSVPVYFWGDISGEKLRNAYYEKYPDTLCIGQRRLFDEDERILLFVKMQIGQKLSENLKRDIHGKIREQLTSRHIPDDILEVADIPYTRNGKKIELAVKQIVSGSKLTPSGDVANPEVLQLYYQFAELPTAKRSLSESRGVGVKSKL